MSEIRIKEKNLDYFLFLVQEFLGENRVVFPQKKILEMSRYFILSTDIGYLFVSKRKFWSWVRYQKRNKLARIMSQIVSS